MSWSAFWIDPGFAGAQIGVATSSILSIVAFRFVLVNMLPPLSYMTRMDRFTLGCMILIFLALIETILTSYIFNNNQIGLARKIDRLSRLAFPVFFVLMFAVTLFI
jgi:hypothetical protein